MEKNTIMISQEAITEVINAIQGRANGDTAKSISQSGVNYKMSFGVTIPELKEIAQPYYGDHNLALELYEQDIRECKIIASMIDDPQQVTGEQIDTWAQSFTILEVVEQVCSNLFWKSDYALSRSIEWCLCGDELMQRAGLIIAARRAFDPDVEDVVFEPYIEIIEGIDDELIAQNKCIIAFALRQIGARNALFGQRVLGLVQRMAESDNEHRAWVGSQLLFEMEGEE